MANIDVTTLSNPLYIGNGANRAKVATDGTITLEGDATVYEDIWGQLTGENLFETPGKADYSFAESCVTLAPSGAITVDGDCVVISFQMPHSAKADSPLLAHIHWEQTDATARTFVYRYRVQSQGAAKTSSWSSDVTVSTATAGVNVFTYTSGTLNQVSKLGSISLTSAGISAVVQLRLARTDAVSGNVNVTFIDCHYEKDSFGSRTEYTK